LASYDSSDTEGTAVKRIQKRGRIIAGVSADTYLLGSRNPFSGKIEGFDIDMVKAMAKAIVGNENAYELRVITAAQRIPSLENGFVDMVARNMTITCDRWTQVGFSTEYYSAGQKILVRRGAKATTLADLAGQRVCAPRGTSSMTNLMKLQPKAIAVGADNHTGCLALFQNGEVDAITGDDTVLAGLAAQDPYAVVPDQKAFTAEPYGLAFNSKDVDLVRFANGVLAQMRTDGQWKRIYDRWLAEALGPAPAPPKAVYGRAT
jgi:polar amino acid transport system substrate-binding protein